MKWIEAKVRFHPKKNDSDIDLIADIFYDMGVKGVVIETPEDGATDDWAEGAKPDISHHAVSGYFLKDETLDKNCQVLEDELLRLKQMQHISSTVAYREIDEEDWAESWKAYFWPEKISDQIVVKPTWREYTKKDNEIVVEIDPGMAFGTGTHPTTSLCIKMIEKYLQPNDSVLDVGTGSGILMIAAAKLGARIVHGVDNDPMAVEIAINNLRLNHIDESKFNVVKEDLVGDVRQQYNMVVSNILAAVIVDLLKSIKNVLAEHGIFICSGFTEDSKGMIEEKLKTQGFTIIDSGIKESWAVITSELTTA